MLSACVYVEILCLHPTTVLLCKLRDHFKPLKYIAGSGTGQKLAIAQNNVYDIMHLQKQHILNIMSNNKNKRYEHSAKKPLINEEVIK